MRVLPGTCGIACILAVLAGVAVAEEDFSRVYKDARMAIVLIDFADQGREVGSGVVVGITESGSALILTANHVVDGYDQVIVYFAGGVEDPRDGIVSEDLYTETEDLAIVVVQDPPEGIDVIRLRESPAKKGERVGAIGHPLGNPFTWSNGSVTNVYGKEVFHDARIERGSSGGPLLDDCSRMLGLNVELIRGGEVDSIPEADLTNGSSVAMGATTIASILDGWFADTRFKRKWGYKKYCSFWQRLYKQPAMLAFEAVLIAGGVYSLWPDGGDGTTSDPTFDNPPGPPSGQ